MEDLASKRARKVKPQVGDHAFTTSRETLCMRKGSLLEAMFSGRHNIKAEEEGSIFIDRDGEHFKLISQLFAGRQTSIGPEQ
jgi:hypothetical protein